jgi:DNA polymerase-3 subunit gamma/tau
LLKTIEEIPQHAVFIFATTEFHKIPATIVSRCQYFNLNKFNEQELVNVIEKVIKTEHINISQEAKVEIIKLSKGHARDVLTMLEQIYSLSNGKEITVENVNDIFGLISIDKKIEFINEIIKCNVEKSLSLINFYYDNGINFEILCEGIITILIDKIIYEQTNDISLLKILTKENINSILLNVEQLFSFINV